MSLDFENSEQTNFVKGKYGCWFVCVFSQEEAVEPD